MIAAFRSMEEALDGLPHGLPDVALIDIGLPGMSGIDGIRHLAQLYPKLHHRKSAAAELGVSVHAVSFHLRQIYGKLQVHSRSEAVAKALRDRLIK